MKKMTAGGYCYCSRSIRFPILSALIVAGLCLSNSVYAQDGEFSFSSGFDYSKGDYGSATDTEIWYIPVTGNYEKGPWRFRVTVPYITIEGPGGVVGGTEGGLVVSGGGGVVTKESGLGDVVAAASYTINPSNVYIPFIELTGKIKFPTADEDDGLGTGEHDYTIQADLYQSLGKISPFMTNWATSCIGAGTAPKNGVKNEISEKMTIFFTIPPNC